MNRRLFGVPLFSLLVLSLALFAVIWPLNANPWGNWHYFYNGLNSIPNDDLSNRTFVYTGAILSETLMPGQAQSIYVFHVLSFAISGFMLFLSMQRLLPGKTWFSYLFAACYLAYVPYNWEHGIALYTAGYTWALFLLSISFSLYLIGYPFATRRDWFSLALSILSGYLAVRSYESTFPVLIIVPVLAFLYLGNKRLTRSFIIGTSMWGGVMLGAFLQFLIPFLTSDSGSIVYQLGHDQVRTPNDFFKNIMTYYQQVLPFESLAEISKANFLLPAVLVSIVAGMGIWLVWRKFPLEHELPTVQQYIGILLIALIIIGLAGSSYAYAGKLEPRSHYFGAAAEALLIVALLGLASRGLKAIWGIGLQVSTTAFILIYFMFGAYWYYLIQHGIPDQRDSISFQTSSSFMREVVSLVPDAPEDTLILYACNLPTAKIDDRTYAFWPMVSYASRYLYNRNINMGPMRFLDFYNIDFVDDGIIYSYPRDNIIQEFYPYSQVILLECKTNGIAIRDSIYSEYAPEHGDFTDYNPYALIEKAFLAPNGNARLLSR